jgi:uncharacterized caspase-like protein
MLVRWTQPAAIFEKGRPEDVLLLYIAGHGDLDDRRNLYFVAHDTRSKRLRGSGIADQFIHETMVRSLSKKQILILDCCFSGAFSKDWISDWNPRSDASVGIKQKLTGEGRVVLTASDALEYSYEKGSVAGEVKSLFSSRLIEGIEGVMQISMVMALYPWTSFTDTLRNGFVRRTLRRSLRNQGTCTGSYG